MEIRRPLTAMGLGLLLLAGGLLAFRLLQRQGEGPSPGTKSAGEVTPDQGVEALPVARYVSALGYIQPRGQVRRLAGINSGAGAARVNQLLVKEGDTVVRGQQLAVFDTVARLQAERQLLQVQMDSLATQLELSRMEEKRYGDLVKIGAVSHDSLDQRRLATEVLAGSYGQVKARLQVIDVDLGNGILRAPMDGTVLQIHAHEGERPSDSVILELGQTEFMEVVAEVYETDISQVQLGQQVIITSEHGGFRGQLAGQVQRIGRKVNRRNVFSSDPQDAVDARVVEVGIALDPLASQQVKNLTRMQVLVRIDTGSSPG